MVTRGILSIRRPCEHLDSATAGWAEVLTTAFSLGVDTKFRGNYSDLRGRQQIAAGGVWIDALRPPGPEQGGQRHLGGRAARCAGAAADLAAHHQVARTPLRRVVG